MIVFPPHCAAETLNRCPRGRRLLERDSIDQPTRVCAISRGLMSGSAVKPSSKVPLVPVPELTLDKFGPEFLTAAGGTAFSSSLPRRRRSQEQHRPAHDCILLNHETDARNQVWGSGSDWSRTVRRYGHGHLAAEATAGSPNGIHRVGCWWSAAADVVSVWTTGSVAPLVNQGVNTQRADTRSSRCEDRANVPAAETLSGWQGPQWTRALLFLYVIVCLGMPLLASSTLAPDQRQALVDLYNATSGPAWRIRTGWANYTTSFSDPCANSWHGVTCDAGWQTVTYVVHYAVAVRCPCRCDGWWDYWFGM